MFSNPRAIAVAALLLIGTVGAAAWLFYPYNINAAIIISILFLALVADRSFIWAADKMVKGTQLLGVLFLRFIPGARLVLRCIGYPLRLLGRQIDRLETLGGLKKDLGRVFAVGVWYRERLERERPDLLRGFETYSFIDPVAYYLRWGCIGLMMYWFFANQLEVQEPGEVPMVIVLTFGLVISFFFTQELTRIEKYRFQRQAREHLRADVHTALITLVEQQGFASFSPNTPEGKIVESYRRVEWDSRFFLTSNLRLLADGIGLFLAFVVTAWLSWPAALLILVPVLLSFVLGTISLLSIRKQERILWIKSREMSGWRSLFEGQHDWEAVNSLNGLAAAILNRVQTVNRESEELRDSLIDRERLQDMIVPAAFFVTIALASFHAIPRVISDELDGRLFLLLIFSMTGIARTMGMAQKTLAQLLRSIDHMETLRDTLDRKDRFRSKPSISFGPEPEDAEVRIELLKLGYPGFPPVIDMEEEEKKGDQTLVVSGQNVKIVGPNGSGKSTLRRLLCGSLQPEAGQVSLGGVPFFDPDPKSALDIRRWVHVIPQESFEFRGTVDLFFDAVSSFVRGEPGDPSEYVEILDLFDLRGDMLRHNKDLRDNGDRYAPSDAKVHKTALDGKKGIRLSAGKTQQLFLALHYYQLRCLIEAGRAPKLVVMDEPYNGVEANRVVETDRLYRELAEKGGFSLWMVTHRQEDIADDDTVVIVMSPAFQEIAFGVTRRAGSLRAMKMSTLKRKNYFREIFASIRAARAVPKPSPHRGGGRRREPPAMDPGFDLE